MKHFFISIFCCVLGLTAVIVAAPLTANAQSPGRLLARVSPADLVRIPLEIDNNIILMRVSINNSKPLKFIFDTGASHSVIDSSRAAELGLKTAGKFSGNATGGTIQGSLIKGVSLSVPGAAVSNQLITSIPFPKIPGFEFDGIIGYGFISQFVVEIDYPNKTMTLFNPRTYSYSGKGEIIPLMLAGRKTPLVRISIILEGRSRTLLANLELDTGADGTFVINSPFAKKHNLLRSLQNATDDRGSGAGGEQNRLSGRIKAARLGRFTFDNPPVAISQDSEGAGASTENNGIIGGEIFRRFKVILDYSRRRMILEPNKNLKDPFDVEITGESGQSSLHE